MAININKASQKDLTEIPGIGKKLAEKIIKFRDEHGVFNTWEDVKQIPGFEDAMVDNLKSAGTELEAQMEQAKETAEEATKEAVSRAKEAQTKVADYTEDYTEISRDFASQVRDSYFMSYKLGLSLMENNLNLMSRYIGHWVSLQQQVYTSLAKINPFVSYSRKN